MSNKNKEQLFEVLNDLTNINNDRIVFYKSNFELPANADRELLSLFKNIISESEHNKEELIDTIKALNVSSIKKALVGKIYKAWSDLKPMFRGNNRRAIVASCKYNEDITRHAYLAALSAEDILNTDTKRLLEAQISRMQQTKLMINGLQQHSFPNRQEAVYFN